MKQLQELQLLAWHVASALPTRQAGLLVIAANSLAPARPHNNFVRLSCRLMHESTMKTSSYRYLDAVKPLSCHQKEVLRNTALDERTARPMVDGDPAPAPAPGPPPARRGRRHRPYLGPSLPLAGLRLRCPSNIFGSAPRASEAGPVAVAAVAVGVRG